MVLNGYRSRTAPHCTLIDRNGLRPRSCLRGSRIVATLCGHTVFREPGFHRIFVEIEPERTRTKATEKCDRVLEDFLTEGG